MQISLSRVRIYPAAILLTSIFGSFFSPTTAHMQPITQEFLVTAYYSPKPDQCCYFRGGYEEEILFNGNGTNGADGTPVYPGMIAAPSSYAFGTRIELPGVGIGTVHDRGGRIIEWEDSLHRIDLWMGYGEEGLARALAWGARRVTGTVYPAGTLQPKESFALNDFPAPIADLKAMPKEEQSLLLVSASFESKSHGVRIMQQALKDAGYFKRSPTGTFGEETKAALASFQRDFEIEGDGTVATDESRAALMVLEKVKGTSIQKLPVLSLHDSGSSVRSVQKLLRYLGYYKGRTNGRFDNNLSNAISSFQLDNGVVSTSTEAGIGVFGPKTKAMVLQLWKIKQVKERSKSYVLKIQITRRIEEELQLSGTLTRGDSGASIHIVQRLLGRLGFMNANEANGYFGPKTLEAIIKYQLSRNVIAKTDSRGAGNIGPMTQKALKKDAVESAYELVRAQGKDAL